MKTKVVNIRHDKADVYIGRPSLFGNPFSLARYGRKDCIEMYRRYFYDRINRNPEFLEAVLALKGKKLGCFCKPKACHGDVIVKFIEDEG